MAVHLTFSPALHKRSSVSISSQTLVILFVCFNNGDPHLCEVVPHYGFDMHFSEITVRWMALERTVRVTKAEMGGSTEREKGIGVEMKKSVA